MRHVTKGGDDGPRDAGGLLEGEVEPRVREETALLSCAGWGARCGWWAAEMLCVPSPSQSEMRWSECSERKAARTSAERMRIGGGSKSISGDEGGVTVGVLEGSEDETLIREGRETEEDGPSSEEGGEGITPAIRPLMSVTLGMIETCGKRAIEAYDTDGTCRRRATEASSTQTTSTLA